MNNIKNTALDLYHLVGLMVITKTVNFCNKIAKNIIDLKKLPDKSQIELAMQAVGEIDQSNPIIEEIQDIIKRRSLKFATLKEPTASNPFSRYQRKLKEQDKEDEV